MNRVILVGRITKDPEVRYTSSNIPVCQFSLAVNRRYQTGNERQADFISCVAWRSSAELLGKYVKKGAQIGVEGQIQTRNYEDAGGVRRYVTEVVCDSITFLESRNRDGSNYSGYSDVDQYDIPQAKNDRGQEEDPFKDISNNFGVSNDELPF